MSHVCSTESSVQVSVRRQAYLEHLKRILPEYRPPQLAPLDLLDEQRKYLVRSTRSSWGLVSPLDETWTDWLTRTGELPPDFETMPSLPFLPDPMVLNEGTANVPLTTKEQWEKKRAWIKEQYQYWITGSIPPPPENLRSDVLTEWQDGKVTMRSVVLRFGPDHRARLRLDLMIPPGSGPFPVLLTQWNHQGWALIAVRRGYLGCTYSGCDADDDTEAYAEIWYPEYDFARLMRRAWGAHRAVDYLYTLDIVDRARIAHAGHSRNGKTSLLVAAFDERVTACVTEGAGTGGEIPFRYTCDKYDNESISVITEARPTWFHPRIRFFIGREHKLPVDQNLLMALIAPRGLLLSSTINKLRGGNPWGIEQAYHSARRVYEFLDARGQIALRLQGHEAARDVEDFIDFLDWVFGRGQTRPPCRTYFDYAFDSWRQLSGETIEATDYPEQKPSELLVGIRDNKPAARKAWEEKRNIIRRRIQWMLGDEPAGATNLGPRTLANRSEMDWDDYLSSAIPRPSATRIMGKLDIGHYPPCPPHRSFGDYLHGNLYYPVNTAFLKKDRLPVVIFLHGYAHATGFVQGNTDFRVQDFFEGFVYRGFVVFAFDLIGFGTRIEEGTRFYERYPHWSKMGKMVVDIRAAVEALSNLDLIDPDRIFVVGYSLGGTLALYAAALDDRVAGVASVCGVTPMRLPQDRGQEGLRGYSHLHGLMPRLGFFVGHEKHLPYDFDELLACIAPRPMLVVAPTWDQDACLDEVESCVRHGREVYGLCGAAQNLELYTPDDYNRFSPKVQERVLNWVETLNP